jgi:hypothetical protein
VVAALAIIGGERWCKGVVMKRFLWVVMMLFVVFGPCAYADGIPIFNVTQAIIPFVTNGAGDNDTFSFAGPLININGGGTTQCDWCMYSDFSLTPGSSLNPSIGRLIFDKMGICLTHQTPIPSMRGWKTILGT